MMITKPLPNSLLFSVVLVLSITMTLTSPNWLLLWLSMEINLLSLLPIMLNSPINSKTEMTIKYFLIQAVSSAMMMLSIMSLFSIKFNMCITMLFMVAILIKLGSAPIHFWVPAVISVMTWYTIFLILTIQKLPSLMIMMSMSSLWPTEMMLFVASLNLIVGTFMALNQSFIRPLLACSSISHMGWLISSMIMSKYMLILYLSVYTLINLIISIQFMSTKTSFSMNLSSSFDEQMFLTSAINMLSLAGLPPLMGFLPKLLVILKMSKIAPTMTILLIMTSAIALIYYLSIIMVTLLSSQSILIKKPMSMENLMSLLIPSCSMMMIIY